MAANKNVGDIAVTIGAESFTLRFGNNEIAILELEWNLDGIGEVCNRGLYVSTQLSTRMAQVALERHHPGIDIAKVRDLCDYKDEKGEKPLVNALIEAVNWSLPKGVIALLTESEAELIQTTRKRLASAD